MNILIITWSGDNDSIDTVSRYIESKGGNVYRVNTDLYPTDVMMSAKYIQGKRILKLKSQDYDLNLNEIDAIWYRRIRMGSKYPKDMDKQFMRASIEESRAVFNGMLASMGVFTIGSFNTFLYAGNKQLQLQLAEELGIDIPRTIITNDAEEVTQFYQEVNTPLITKMQHTFSFYEEGQESLFFTNELTEDHLNDLEGLEICPMIFQEKIEKKLELRATIIGDKIFTASIDSTTSDLTKVDWRRDSEGIIDQWKVYELPNELQNKLLMLMNKLGLTYGAADIIVTPDNRFVFLELNPAGEFCWLDELFEGKIAEAIAQVLTDKAQCQSNETVVVHS